MRIVHLVHSLRRGGAERIVVELAAGAVQRGHDVRILGLLTTNQYSEDMPAGMRYDACLEAEEYRFPWSGPRLRNWLAQSLRDSPADVVQVHAPTASLVAAAAFVRPLVHMMHGYSDSWSDRVDVKQAALRWLLRRSINPRDQVIAVSNDIANGVSRWLRVDKSRISVIPNGIDVDWLWSSRERFVGSAPRICTVGTLSEVKRVLQVLSAFGLLLKSLPAAKLVVAGDGPMKESVKQRTADLGIGHAVTFLGTIRDVPGLLGTSDILWHLSRSEGSPLACLEAMAAGVPIVGTDVRGIRDVISHGVTGMLVPLDDSQAVVDRTLDLVRSEATYRTISDASRRFVESNHGAARMIDRHIEVLQKLCFQWKGSPTP